MIKRLRQIFIGSGSQDRTGGSLRNTGDLLQRDRPDEMHSDRVVDLEFCETTAKKRLGNVPSLGRGIHLD